MIAIGFKNGTVIILKGEITRDKQSRQKFVHKESNESTEPVYVTGMFIWYYYR